MTNRDIMSIFKGRYPELKVDDYRPLTDFCPNCGAKMQKGEEK